MEYQDPLISRYQINEFTDFMILKNFSQRTIKTYSQQVLQFIRWHVALPSSPLLSDDSVKQYLLYRFKAGMCWQTVNSDYSSIQKYFKNILFLPWSLTKLPRPRREKKLPSVLSRQDVINIIQSAATYKHQVLLAFIYATGLRLSEAIHVKIDDLDGHRKLVRVNKGKGSKDRFVLLSDSILCILRKYYLLEKPKVFLFNGIKKASPLSPRAVQLAMYEAKKNAGISKIGSIHTLRNCYATHHLESGTDLVFLQEQLGHKQLRTTIRYIGLCVERQRYIKHPLDQMSITFQK